MGETVICGAHSLFEKGGKRKRKNKLSCRPEEGGVLPFDMISIPHRALLCVNGFLTVFEKFLKPMETAFFRFSGQKNAPARGGTSAGRLSVIHKIKGGKKEK